MYTSTRTFFLVSFLVWFSYVLIVDVTYLTRANVPPSDPEWLIGNPATDRRWCCVYGTHAGTELVCANTATCSILPSDLHVEPKFIFRFVCNILLIAYILFADIMYTCFAWRPRLNDYLDDLESEPVKKINGMVLKRYTRYTRSRI